VRVPPPRAPLQALSLSDVALRQQALGLLGCYHPMWLAVGLQTVLGKALVLTPGAPRAAPSPPSPSPATSHLLATLRNT
jgi:abnormal spindle-like microcephaly-associated protein